MPDHALIRVKDQETLLSDYKNKNQAFGLPIMGEERS